MRTIAKKSFAGVAGTNTVLAILAPTEGVIDLTNVNFFADAVGTYKKYVYSQKCVTNAAVSASTTMVIKTDAAGKIGGAVLTTSDLVLVAASDGTGYQQRTIAAVGAVSSSTVSLTLGVAVTCAALDVVYIVRVAKVTSRATTDDEIRIDAKNQGSSEPRMPLTIEVNATGTNTLSGSFDVLV